MDDKVTSYSSPSPAETPTPITPEQPTINPFTEELSAHLINPEVPQPITTQQSNITAPIKSVEQHAKRPNRFLNSKVWISIAILILALCGGTAIYLTKHKAVPKNSTAKTTAIQPTATTSATVTSTIQNYTIDASSGLVTIPTQVYSFLSSPQPIADPDIINDYNAIFGINTNCGYTGAPSCSTAVTTKPSSVNFYKIGTIASGQSVIAIDGPSQGPGGNMAYFLINDAPDHYIVMGDLSQINYDHSTVITNKVFKNNVVFTKGGIPTEFNFPATTKSDDGKIILNNLAEKDSTGTLMTTDSGFSWYISPGSITAIDSLGKSGRFSINKVTTTDKINFSISSIYLTINKIFSLQYTMHDNLIGNKPAITWSDGSSNSNDYVSTLPGCGRGGGHVIVKNITKNTLTAIGSGPDGQTLYQLPNDNAYLQEFYNGDYKVAEQITDNSLKNLNIDQYQAKHAVFVAQNSLGEWVAYMRSDMFDHGGCAKPVIYLYPTKTTRVSVKLGATVTKSDPTYLTNTGWQNVTAQPNGQLSYQGKPYNYLFWEGFGLGAYPDLRTGTVVARGEVVATIKDQLKAQGLNSIEIRDFLDFWQPKLPKTPYTLLRWLTTEQMNHLAPLSISPTPNTVIRTFLDFKGLDKPINVAPQTFNAPARNGFTVIEWGGLQ